MRSRYQLVLDMSNPEVIEYLYNSISDILKNNKNVIKTDYDVKVRLEILKNRMDDLLSNI